MFIYSFPRPVTLLVEFEGVDDVLPDAVEAAGDGNVDQYYVGHCVRKTSAQLAGNHSRRCRRRADKAEHGALGEYSEVAVRHGGDQPGERDECRDLERKHKEMPFPESEVVRGDRVELEEQHRGHENRLDILGEPRESRLDGSRQRIDKEQDQIGCDPEDDCQRQHPVLDEFPDSSHIRHNPAFLPAEIVKPTDLKNSPPSIGL